MKKMFMLSLGGKVEGGNIEVHDVQFVVGENIDDVIPRAKASWYGIEFKLHLDSWKEIKGADGYRIEVTETAQNSGQRLYFACLGGYKEHLTQEIHDVRLVMAPDEEEAKIKAMNMGDFDYVQPHVDHMTDVEDRLLSADGKTYHLKMTLTDETYDLAPDWFGFRRLDLV